MASTVSLDWEEEEGPAPKKAATTAKKAMAKAAIPVEPVKPIPPQSIVARKSNGNGYESYSLQCDDGPAKGTTFLSMGLSTGNLQCCGMGTIFGFSLYHFNRAVLAPKRQMPTPADIQKYLSLMVTGQYAYPEWIGVLGPSQQTEIHLGWLRAMFFYEEIHKTTNKNYDSTRMPLLVIKIQREVVAAKWGIVRSGDAATKLTPKVDETQGGQAYLAWLKKHELIYKG